MKDDIPFEVKTERMDAIMLLQQEINLKKNQSLIGLEEKVIIDRHSADGTSIGRTFRDAPEVDNFVRVDKELPIGEFAKIKNIDASEYDIKGQAI